MGFRDWFRGGGEEIAEAQRAIPASQAKIPERAGFAYGVPLGGLDENSGAGSGATGTSRESQLDELYDAYQTCTWAYSSVQAIAKTITAGGLVMDWDSDTGEGDEKAPEKPEAVLAAERLIAFVNPRQNIRQLMRNVVVDLLVFGDAFVEVTWWGDVPVALYNLDCPTTTPITDVHGQVSAYVQMTGQGQRADFEPREVIHISLDAPRSGVFGLAPMMAASLSVRSWLWAATTGKEMMRKGLPPTVHADFPAGRQEKELTRWRDRIFRQNIGPRNIGAPWITQGGATLKELQAGKIADILAFLSQRRDEILSSFGVPPAKVGVIESGNLGGGTGESQDRTFRIDVCAPIAELVLEAFNFAIIKQGFGIEEWHAKFRDVDYRSSQIIEQIRDMRIRNGSWTVNKARTEIGEPAVDGGDDAVIIDRQNLVLVKDLAAMSKATVEKQQAGAAAPAGGLPGGPGQQDQQPGSQQDDAAAGGGRSEAVSPLALARYRRRLAEALDRTALTEAKADGGKVRRDVYSQLSENFPPDAIAWVKDAAWSGPQRVPLADLDTEDRAHWSATHEPSRVSAFARKLRRRQRDGRELKPAILVRTPGAGKDLIADGHHRVLAYEQQGLRYVWAYVGHVSKRHGPWDRLALSQVSQKREDAA